MYVFMKWKENETVSARTYFVLDENVLISNCLSPQQLLSTDYNRAHITLFMLQIKLLF